MVTGVARVLTIAAPLEGAVPLYVNEGNILVTQRPAASTAKARSAPAVFTMYTLLHTETDMVTQSMIICVILFDLPCI